MRPRQATAAAAKRRTGLKGNSRDGTFKTYLPSNKKLVVRKFG